MSFILDALKKSDNSREQAKIPNLQTMHDPPPLKKASGRAIWPYLLAAALVVNAGVLAWWLGSWGESEVAAERQPAVVTAERSAPVPVARSLAQETAVPAVPPRKPRQVVIPAAPQPSLAKALPQAPPQPVSPRASEPPAPRLYEWDELPQQVRSSVPELALSVHFYTDAPAQRMVRINGRILRQGQTVEGDLVLEEIVAEGVILTSRGYRFRVAKPQPDAGS